MELLQIFDHAFHAGCGVRFTDVLTSARYEELATQQETLKQRFPANTHRGIALRAGHLVMGKLFNTLSEKAALARAKHEASEFGHGMELRSLIRLLGEHLIVAAEKCLPDEVVSMASEWSDLTAHEQLAITEKLFYLFRSKSQEASDAPISMETLDASIRKSRQVAYRFNSSVVLPQQYGRWHAENEVVDCQGKTQMLVAFARLAGAPVMCVSPISFAKTDFMDQWRSDISNQVMQHIQKRGIKFPSEIFWSGCQAEIYLSLSRRLNPRSFHVCVAIQLKDKRWVMIDPHSINWGVFPNFWELDKLYTQLHKYAEVLPGLSLIAHDQGFHQQLYEQHKERILTWLARSEKLQDAIGTPETPMDIANALIETDEIAFILREMAIEDGCSPPEIFPPEYKQLMAMAMALGADDPFDSMGKVFEIMHDPDGLKKRVGEILTIYHFLIIQSLGDQVNVGGGLLHPQCEFALADYQIATSVLNSLMLDFQLGHELNAFMLNYSFGQMELSNATTDGRTSLKRAGSELARAAAHALYALPFRHSVSEHKLRAFPLDTSEKQGGGK